MWWRCLRIERKRRKSHTIKCNGVRNLVNVYGKSLLSVVNILRKALLIVEIFFKLGFYWWWMNGILGEDDDGWMTEWCSKFFKKNRHFCEHLSNKIAAFYVDLLLKMNTFYFQKCVTSIFFPKLIHFNSFPRLPLLLFPLTFLSLSSSPSKLFIEMKISF